MTQAPELMTPPVLTPSLPTPDLPTPSLPTPDLTTPDLPTRDLPAGGAEALARIGVPEPAVGTVPRHRLSRCLSAASAGAVTVVEAPSGAGKTTGVAGWVRDVSTFDAAVWLSADALAHDVLRFWGGLCSALTRAGFGPLPPLPSTGGDEFAWAGWLAATAATFAARGRRWLIVLDDFPVGPPCWLGDQIVSLVSRAGGNLHLVVTASGPPAVDVRVVREDGTYAHIGPELLEMDGDEVAAVLMGEGVRVAAGDGSSVAARTFGWARGVNLAARVLRHAPAEREHGDDLGSLPQVSMGPARLDDLDTALDALVDREILSPLSPAVREVVIRTSVAAEVSPDLARVLLGGGSTASLDPMVCRHGFVDQQPDGSFRCHPLLRRSARRRLDTEWPALAGSVRRAAAEWYLAAGRRAEGIALAAQVDDSGWLAASLVASLAVPAIVLGAADDLPIDAAQRVAVERAEPLLAAAAATARGDVAAAEAALASSNRADVNGADQKARQLSEAVIRMALARQSADHHAGLGWVETCRALVAELTSSGDGAPELTAMVDGHEAVFLLWRGELDAAMSLLAASGELGRSTATEQLAAAAEVAGVLAWLHALRGNLTRAARQAALVLTMRTADRDEAGVGYAQLAAAWVHLERGELEQAEQRLVHAMQLDDRQRDPWLVAARCLTEARLATACGDPDVALRLLAATPRPSASTTDGWLADRQRVAVAEAHLAAGDPQRALATLTPEPLLAPVEARVVAAAARRAVGDRRGAVALLAGAEERVATAPLPAAVQVWVLSAQLACDGDHPVRARSLVERALRTADREDLRLALSSEGPWLSAFLDRDPELLRTYRNLVTAVRRVGRPTRRVVTVPESARLTESLTARELQVLELLAQLCTTEEIAAELYVTANTVKTHIRSLFLKLAVNRRSDAVRRGRQLGIC